MIMVTEQQYIAPPSPFDGHAKPHISWSQLRLFGECPEAWRRRYVDGDKIPPGIKMAQGVAVHYGAECNWRHKLEAQADLSSEQIQDIACDKMRSTIDAGLALSKEERRRGSRIVMGEAIDRTALLAELFAKKVAPQYQPALIEQQFVIELPEASHDLVGILDLATDLRKVVNFKTSGKKHTADDVAHSPQLTLEAAGYQQITGHRASEVRLDVLYNWARPCRSVLRSQRGEADFTALACRVNAMLRAIEQGNFPPRSPGSGMCSRSRCGYFSTCSYVAGERI